VLTLENFYLAYCGVVLGWLTKFVTCQLCSDFSEQIDQHTDFWGFISGMPWRDRCGRCQDCMTNDGSRSTCTSSSTTRLWREGLVVLKKDCIVLQDVAGKILCVLAMVASRRVVSCSCNSWVAVATRELRMRVVTCRCNSRVSCNCNWSCRHDEGTGTPY